MSSRFALPPLLAAFLSGRTASASSGVDARTAATPGAARPGFLRFPGTGGGWVLLDARNPAVFRAGTALLPRGRFVTRIASRVVRASSHVGLHARLARGRVEGANLSSAGLHARFPALPADLACNAASGVPGRDQKTIVQLVTRAGRVVAFAKLADAPHARALVRHEARVLELLAARGVAAPGALGLEDDADATVLVQSALHGERAPGRFGPAHAAFLADLAARTRVELPADEHPGRRVAHERLEALAARADRDWLEAYAALHRSLAPRSADERVPGSLAHGDFTPWNAVVGADGLRAFDWEHALLTAPLGHDALHFVLQQAILVERVPHAMLRAHVLARLAPHAELIAPRAFDRALGAYLLELGLSDELRQLEQRSPFAQVDWLRDARLALVTDQLRRGAPRERAA
ncbi:MAG: phosphotransferase [Planctomycetes bacterium]|nr:phosphotransferase [Planctomycetota bacterium]